MSDQIISECKAKYMDFVCLYFGSKTIRGSIIDLQTKRNSNISVPELKINMGGFVCGYILVDFFA